MHEEALRSTNSPYDELSLLNALRGDALTRSKTQKDAQRHTEMHKEAQRRIKTPYDAFSGTNTHYEAIKCVYKLRDVQ